MDEWGTLDFGEIEKSLAKKLTDYDVCIAALTNLKILRLAGCVNITGHGLEPLRGSLHLEQLDLSLVKKHVSPILKMEAKISDSAILQILPDVQQGVLLGLRSNQTL